MFEQLPKPYQTRINAALKFTLKDEEPEMAQLFRELIAEKMFKEGDTWTLPSANALMAMISNFAAGWHAHESMMCDMIVAVSKESTDAQRSKVQITLPPTTPKSR